MGGWPAFTFIEARKADGATSTALRTPSPPNFTGSDACVQALSSLATAVFVTSLKIKRKVLSYSISISDLKQRAVRSRYWSFGWQRSSEAKTEHRELTKLQTSLPPSSGHLSSPQWPSRYSCHRPVGSLEGWHKQGPPVEYQELRIELFQKLCGPGL